MDFLAQLTLRAGQPREFRVNDLNASCGTSDCPDLTALGVASHARSNTRHCQQGCRLMARLNGSKPASQGQTVVRLQVVLAGCTGADGQLDNAFQRRTAPLSAGLIRQIHTRLVTGTWTRSEAGRVGKPAENTCADGADLHTGGCTVPKAFLRRMVEKNEEIRSKSSALFRGCYRAAAFASCNSALGGEHIVANTSCCTENSWYGGEDKNSKFSPGAKEAITAL